VCESHLAPDLLSNHENTSSTLHWMFKCCWCTKGEHLGKQCYLKTFRCSKFHSKLCRIERRNYHQRWRFQKLIAV